MSVKIELNNFFDMKAEEIELSSFMIFCGDNGVGKTHLIKMLTAIDTTFRNRDKLNELVDMILKNENSDFSKYKFLDEDLNDSNLKIEEEELEKFYIILEKSINSIINSQKEMIFSEYFQDDVIKKMGEIKMKFTKRENIIINVKNNDEFKNVNENMITIEENEQFDNYGLNVQIGDNNVRTFIARRKRNDKDFSAITRKAFSRIILRNLTLLIYKINFQSDSSDILYLPASREAYIRDYDYFLKKSTNDSNIAKDWLKEETKEIYVNEIDKKNHSDDPFIEKYVMEIVSSFKNNDNNNKNKKIVDYLENDIIKAKIISSKGKLKYKLKNGEEISPIQASSLQNEYSFFTKLVQNNKFRNFVIEEPEAHLSLTNATKFAFVLLALHQKGYIIWITTHNTFIADTINNFIMISKLKSEKRTLFLKKFGINNLFKKLNLEKVNEISGVYIRNNEIVSLQKGKQGIIFKEFISQVNNFIDLSSELQNEFWDDNEDE